MRKKLSQELGFLVPPVHIRDNLELAPNAYRISLAGVAVGEGVVYPDRELAINPGRVFGKLPGIETRDPAFGLEAIWIEPREREQAQTLGYTVVDAEHRDRHAPEPRASRRTRTSCSATRKCSSCSTASPRARRSWSRTWCRSSCRSASSCACCRACWPSACRSATCARSSRRWPSTRRAPRTRRCCRRRCASRSGARSCRTSPASARELPVITLEPELEQLLQGSLRRRRRSAALEPGLAERLQTRLADRPQRQEAAGEPAVLMVAPPLRATLARFTRASVPGLHVLAWNEIPDNRRVRLVAAVGR